MDSGKTAKIRRGGRPISSGLDRRSRFDRFLPPAAAATAFICQGLTVTATRFAVAQCDPLTLALMRNGMVFVLLFPFLRTAARGAPPVTAQDFLYMALLGLSSFALFPLLFTIALSYSSASHGALALPGAAPSLTLALSAFLGRERLTAYKVCGVIIAALGVAAALSDTGLATAPQNSGPNGNLAWLGDAIMICAAGTVATYNVLSGPFIKRYGTFRLLFIASGAGTAALLFLALLWPRHAGTPWQEFDATEWWAILIIGLTSAVANWCWAWALSATSPTRVAVFIALSPLAGMGGAILFLGEQPTIALALGLILVVFGITLVNFADRAKRQA